MATTQEKYDDAQNNQPPPKIKKYFIGSIIGLIIVLILILVGAFIVLPKSKSGGVTLIMSGLILAVFSGNLLARSNYL